MLKGLYLLHNETLLGAAPPLTFHKGKAPDVKCFFVGVVTTGKIKQKGGAQCVS